MDKERLKSGLHLFAFFFKIGCFTFGGGWSILAQMEQEFVEKRNMITKDELLDLVAIGKSIPGIMITNISMLFGYRIGGWFGGICSVFGIACPAVLILSLITLGYDAWKENEWCYCILKGIRGAVVSIIASAAFSLGKDIFRSKNGLIIVGIAFVLCVTTNISNIVLIGVTVLAAIIWNGGKAYGHY